MFGERKVYIGTNLCDMKPLQEITKDAISITEELPTPECINATGTVACTIKFTVNSEKILKGLLKLIRKPRKTTYKTLRHDCAKRRRIIMAVLPKPFPTDGYQIVVGEDFYRIRQCEHIFTPCGLCDLRNSQCIFKPKSQWDQDCPFAIRDQYLERCRTVTEDMKKTAERLHKDNPDAAWFLLKRNERRPPQNEQPHNSDNMETTKTTFRDIAGRIADLQEKKNESYGNAFGQSCDKYGVVSALTRLNDKLNRLDSLYKSSELSAFGESFTDTLTDLAAYAIMTIEWIENGQSSRMESAGTGSQASAE